MIIAIASYKGGVAKSTTVAHLAAYFSRTGRTLVVDGDPNGSVTRWAAPGRLPFSVVGTAEAAMCARAYDHILIDTKARPEPHDFSSIVRGCDLLILPCSPDPLSLDALVPTATEVRRLGRQHFRVLLTLVPPRPSRRGQVARASLEKAGFPVFRAQIPRLVAFQECIQTGSTVYSPEYEALGEEIEALHTPTSLPTLASTHLPL